MFVEIPLYNRFSSKYTELNEKLKNKYTNPVEVEGEGLSRGSDRSYAEGGEFDTEESK
jgi:hypothetical protein